MKLEAAQAFSTVVLLEKLDTFTSTSVTAEGSAPVLFCPAFVMEMNRRLLEVPGTLQEVWTFLGRAANNPVRATVSRVPWQLLAILQLPASAVAAAANVGIGASPQFMAAATEPPEEPASLVVVLMTPRDLRIAETPTKYMI